MFPTNLSCKMTSIVHYQSYTVLTTRTHCSLKDRGRKLVVRTGACTHGAMVSSLGFLKNDDSFVFLKKVTDAYKSSLSILSLTMV